jgi:hypothetical protein
MHKGATNDAARTMKRQAIRPLAAVPVLPALLIGPAAPCSAHMASMASAGLGSERRWNNKMKRTEIKQRWLSRLCRWIKHLHGVCFQLAASQQPLIGQTCAACSMVQQHSVEAIDCNLAATYIFFLCKTGCKKRHKVAIARRASW